MAAKFTDVVEAGVKAGQSIGAVCVAVLVKRHKMKKQDAVEVVRTVNSTRSTVAKLRRLAKHSRKPVAARKPKRKA